MPHIHTEPGQHDLTVSAFITNRHQQILVNKHKKFNRYMQPGGHVELHEDPWTAILREIEEETGYCKGQLLLRVPPTAVIERFVDEPHIFHSYPVSFNTHPIGDDGHLHTDIGFAFTVIDDTPNENPATGESEDVRWINRFEIENSVYNIPRNVQVIMQFVMTEVVKTWPVFHCGFLGLFDDDRR